MLCNLYNIIKFVYFIYISKYMQIYTENLITIHQRVQLNDLKMQIIVLRYKLLKVYLYCIGNK